MATLDQIGAALKAADAAGNTDDARRLALAYAQMRDSASNSGPDALPTVTVKAPERLPGVLGDINDFGNDLGDAVVHHLGNLPAGLAQAGAHGLQSLVNAGASTAPNGSIGQRLASAVNAKVAGLDSSIQNREANYQQNVPDSAGSYIGATIGEVAPWLVGGGEARAAGLAPQAATRLGRLAMSASEGGVMGAAQPVTSGGYGTGKRKQVAIGGVSAPIAYAAGSGVGRLAALAKNTNKLGATDRAAADILTREADNPSALSKAAPSQVPGVQRTLAEETLDPGIARVERNLRSTNRQFDALDRSNNAARVGQLDKIAGTEADYANAEAVRSKVTGKLRDTAFSEGARHDAALAEQSLVNRGVGNNVDSTMGPLQDHIRSIVNANQGRPSVLNTMAVVDKAIQNAGDSVGGLYNVRKEIGDMLSGRAGGETAAAKSATPQLISMRDAIDKELTRRAPSFSRYLLAFQDFSKPINRMDVGRDLVKSGSSVLDPVTGSPVLTPAQFSKKARDLDQVAARATGFAKAKVSDILSPSDISSIKAIQDDLERQAFRATAGSGGNSQTFERGEVQKRISRGVGRETLRHVPVLGRYAGDFLDMIDKSRNDRVKERLAYLVANPDEARRVLSALTPGGRKIVSNALSNISAPAGRLATQPTGQQQSQ